jgi:GH15 family glucan-1,4-alpha-glucosidase
MQMSIDERLPKVGDEALFRQLKRLGEHALRYAFEPNSDILEYRERAKVHAYSAALCWAACDRLGQFAHRLRLSKRARYWHAHAVPITDKSLAEVWHKKRGALTGALGHSDLDASVLLCGDLGLFASTDPRFGSTCDVIRCELMRKGRITPYMADDDFGAPETALLACSFCHIGALCLIGRKDDAQQMFDDSFERGNAFGRLSEDIRPETGELWGNFAQAYSMVEIINTATRMSSSWEEEGWARV